MEIVVKIENSRKLRQKMLRVSERVRTQAVRKALGRAGVVVRTEAKRRAPRRTGSLRREIKSWVKKTKRGYQAHLGFSDKIDYGWYVEYGTDYFTGRNFLRGALRDKEDECVAAFTSELNRVLDSW